MKKPEVEKEVTVIEHLSSRVKHLESERREMIDALREAQTWLKTLPKEQFGTYGEDMGTKLWVRDDVLQQIKQALRNAGETEDE